MSHQPNSTVLHPESEGYLKISSALPPVDYDTLLPTTARNTSNFIAANYGGSTMFEGTREEIHVPQPRLPAADGAGTSVPCWLYRPSAAAAKPHPSICIYFHGGGWVVCNRQTHDVVCKDLATLGECIVINVEYRLAPESKCPACYEDGEAVVRWVLQNKERLGGGAGSRVGLAGDSAGGNIAASLCHSVGDDVAYQVLIYPAVDLTYEHPLTYAAYGEFYTGYALSVPYMLWFRKHFLTTEEERRDPMVSPLFHKSFERQPPAFILIAMCDPLRDEGLAYAKKLEDAGVSVELLKMDGIIHGFVNRAGAFPTTYRAAVESIGKFISKF